ncbi:MAG: hypothetical protein H0U46_05655 [Actinobacteria bacterium]|nr:hypothetical protein [Actinomycetota bacterium]
MVIAIDPGPARSAYVLYEYDLRVVTAHGILPNDTLARGIVGRERGHACAIEMIASYGMAVGAEVFETVYWIGRFAERWYRETGLAADRLVRRDVKMHLCGNNAAKDGNLRAVLIDRFGPGKVTAIGTKRAPGPLYGVRADEWQALALAVTWAETRASARKAAT